MLRKGKRDCAQHNNRCYGFVHWCIWKEYFFPPMVLPEVFSDEKNCCQYDTCLNNGYCPWMNRAPCKGSKNNKAVYYVKRHIRGWWGQAFVIALLVDYLVIFKVLFNKVNNKSLTPLFDLAVFVLNQVLLLEP